jgi:tRNA threonylcarbamoyladenosine biosynthesis protein TsaB
MLVLAFDTSTPTSSVGWAEIDLAGPRPEALRYASFVAPAEPGHAETLLDRVRAALATGGYDLKDVELLVFGRGPGTFTGLRIGLGTAKGLALAFGTKLVGLSSLEALALSAGVDGLVAPLIDARRGELYAALYDVRRDGDDRPRAALLAAEQVVRPEGLAELLRGHAAKGAIRFAGNGALRYADAIRALGVQLSSGASAADPLRMAIAGAARFLSAGADDPIALEPSYLREPDAKLPKPAF